MHGRSPRRLHLPVQVDDFDVFYEFYSRDRLILPREILAEAAAGADATRIVTERSLRTLSAWMAARYDRTAFPDTFQNRLNPVRKELLKQARKLIDVPEAFIALNSWDEVADAVPYEVVLVFVMPDGLFSISSRRTGAQKAVDAIAKLLRSCNGVSLGDDPTLVSDDEFTLADMKMMRRWGDFDYLSLADSNGHVPSASPR